MMMLTTAQPSLFLSHGSPTFALETPATSFSAAYLADFAKTRPAPRGIVIVSPHWQTRGTGITVANAAAPETVYDFGGFPKAMYQLKYPAPGSPELANLVSEHLQAAYFQTSFAPQQGWDHGVWVPLMKLYPDAQIPVVQISMPAYQTPQFNYGLGQALAGLREQGIMVIASGSLTHNLYEVRLHEGSPQPRVAPYVVPFREWVQEKVLARDLQSLLNYRALAPFAKECHPTDEHWMPIYVALGAGDFENAASPLDYVAGELVHYTLAMDHAVLG